MSANAAGSSTVAENGKPVTVLAVQGDVESGHRDALILGDAGERDGPELEIERGRLRPVSLGSYSH